MSTVQAFIVFFLLLACLALVVWLFLRGWSPEQLPLWAGLIWGTITVMTLAPKFLPASIRWHENVSIVQVIFGVAVLVLSIKCLIMLIRHGSTLSDTQRSAAWLGVVPLIIGVMMAALFFWMAGAFNVRK
jgi:hypothetical protein